MYLLGLFGGAFDPVHIGHLRIAERARAQLSADEFRFLPLCKPAHRAEPDATAEQRLAMLELALSGREGVKVDARELRRGGISWTVDTLRSVRREVGDACALFCLIGEDAFSRLETWREWRSLAEYAHLVIYPRKSARSIPDSLSEWMSLRLCAEPMALSKSPCGSLYRMTGDPIEASATEVRAGVGAGHDMQALLPEAVWDYIQREKLYQ